MPPYKTQVDCSVYNSGNDVSKQTQQISNLISQGVDAIVINAASPTGLNGIIGQACARGILVVSYDNVVTAPCALKVNTDQFAVRRAAGARTSSTSMHGKGNVIMVTGVAGTFVDEAAQQGRRRGLQEVPGHQGRRPLHRHVGLLHRAAQHRRAAAVAAEDRRHLGARAAPTASSRRSSTRSGRHCRRPPARPRTASASSCCRRATWAARRGHLDRPAAVPRARRRSSSPAQVLAEEAREEEHRDPVPDRHREDGQDRADGLPEPARQLLRRTSPTPARRPP